VKIFCSVTQSHSTRNFPVMMVCVNFKNCTDLVWDSGLIQFLTRKLLPVMYVRCHISLWLHCLCWFLLLQMLADWWIGRQCWHCTTRGLTCYRSIQSVDIPTVLGGAAAFCFASYHCGPSVPKLPISSSVAPSMWTSKWLISFRKWSARTIDWHLLKYSLYYVDSEVNSHLAPISQHFRITHYIT